MQVGTTSMETGELDLAMGAFQASVCDDPNVGCVDPAQDRFLAGEVHLVFGTGAITGTVDTGVAPTGNPVNRLLIAGDQVREAAGSEVWMDDVTGDGLGDLLIARQNFSPDSGRIGAGALTILVGGASVRTFANTLQVLDLRTPPMSLTVATLVGASTGDRLGIWLRTGDIDGDGIADILVGADQLSSPTETHRGAAYVIRGGSHLAASQTIDLADFPSPGSGTSIAGDIARVVPPAGSTEYHFGATVQVADLDGNQRAEVIAAAALNRAGAALPPANSVPGSTHATGGSIDGTVYIAWDDNFPASAWSAGYEIDLGSPPGTRSILDGPARFTSFGEEMLGGLDYDADGTADLFVGDLVAFVSGEFGAGRGLVLYDVTSLKGLDVELETPPVGLVMTEFLGGGAGHIAADTAMHGDFDGDGFDDLAFSSPHANPFGRIDAGTLHVFHGQTGPWPSVIDLASGMLPPVSQARISEIFGAMGSISGDNGDVLCYSGAAADMDGDGRTDFITNEMLGNGVAPADIDAGNLIVISGALVPEPSRASLVGAAVVSIAALRRFHPKTRSAV